MTVIATKKGSHDDVVEEIMRHNGNAEASFYIGFLPPRPHISPEDRRTVTRFVSVRAAGPQSVPMISSKQS